MPSYVAGSVSAKIELDTTDFDKKIEGLKGKVDDLKVALQKNGLADVSKQIKEYEEALQSQKNTIQDLTERISEYKKQLKSLREGHNQNTGDIKKEVEQLNLESKAYDKATKAAKEYDAIVEKVKKDGKIKRNTYKQPSAADFSEPTWKVNPELEAQVGLEGLKMAYHEYDKQQKEAAQKDKEYWQTRQSTMRNAMEAMVSTIRIMASEQVKSFATTQTGYNGYLNTLSRVQSAYGKVSNVAPKAAQAGKTFNEMMAETTSKYSLFHTSLERVNWELQEVTKYIGSASQVLKTFNFQLLGLCDTESKAYENTLKLASAIQRMNTQGTENWSGRGQFGYSSYISSISKVNQTLEKQRQLQQSLKQQKLDQYYAKVGSASTKYWNQIRNGTVNLNTYKANMSAINKLLDQQTQRTQKLASAQYRLFQKYHTTNLNTYKANMAEINQKLAEQTKNTGSAEQGIRKTGTSMVNAAHSGRILSNTLYQIRGALLSLKMIFTAMGGMALWGFATEIAEGIKTTFTAKNEMEEQLKANTKVGASGLQVFNRELDNTISKFKKVNKYALGETVSSLGLEFELNTKQMSEAMDIVAMIQSEYVRAGRTQEEAALAVKDILQGEFQRLSRETGVGKEELLAYGWSGDTKDIDSILKAVKKAGEDRNWDLFAAKATSLNDVIQITKSRFEEFGADLLQSISPMIVGAFNTLAGGLEGLKKAFDGLGSFGKNTVFAGLVAGITTLIGTGLPMVTKGMGLADVATIGWCKSLGTAVLNLNKTTVAQHGFRKALAEVITGTKAEQLATVSSTKAIFGRILGINQSVMAQKGLLSALVAHKMELKGVEAGATRAAVANGKWYQKVEYLTAGFNKQGKVSDSLGRSLLRTATSWKVLRTAMLGVIGIAAIAWYSSMATWADTVRKNIEGLNEVIDNGDSMVKEATSTVNNYETALSKLTEGTNEYKKAYNNLQVAKANEKDIKQANELAKVYKKQNEQAEKNIATQHKLQMARSYELAGIDPTKASEMASGWTERVKAGQQNWIDSMNIYNDRLYKSSQHINEHIALMKEAGLTEEQRLKYINEYSMKAEEVAENWKKFNQGDMTAGAYALLGELQLQWIDLWNNDHFLNFWNSVKDTWEDLKPTIYAIKDALMDLGNVMLDFFSTKHGQLIGGITLTGVALFALGTKIYHVLGGAKSTIDIFKTLGGKLKDISGKWKDVGDKAEEANEKMGGGKSTGGIKGEKAKGWIDKAQIQSDVQKYTRAAVAIAAGMALITEAIVLLNAPMLALAGTGMVFEHLEPQIRSGIKGLQLIAPTVMALLPPVIALCYVFAKFNVESSTIISGAKTAAIGIAAGMLLVAEAVVMLVAPMLAIAALGYVNGLLGDGLQQGKQAITLMGEAVMAMAPVIPVFAAALIMGAIAVATGGTGFVAEAAAIAAGMLLVSEAILSLAMPMAAIAALGYISVNLGGMQQGAEAIKQTAEALKYVSEAMGYLAAVAWENLSYNIATVLNNLTGHDLGSDLQKLTEENGVIDQLNKFTIAFNQHTIEPIQQDKVTNLQNAATGITTIGDAMQAVKTAMDNLPQEFKNGATASGTPAENYAYNTQTDAATATTDATGYFDQFKQPLKELKNFIYEFNHSEDFAIEQIDTGRVAAINSAADMIVQVQTAVDKVKATMGMVVDAGWNQNMATGGIFAAVSGYLGGLTAGTTGGSAGAEGYSSSLGSSLKEMENVIKDLVTFNNNVNSILGSGEGDSSAAGSTATAMANMVTAVDQAIQHLSETLSNAVPTIKGNATAIGQGIHDGIKDGMGDLTSVVLPPFLNAMKSVRDNAGTYGKGAGWKLTHGFDSELKLKEATEAEVNYTMQYLDGKKPDFYNKGAELGDELSRGYKEHGLQQQSPGLMARSTLQEMYYMQDSLDVGMSMLPQKAVELGNALTSNFNPQLGLGGLSVDDLSQFQSGLNQISTMANTTNMQTSAAFTNMNMNTSTNMMGMTSTVNGAFNNIQQNTTTKYNQIVNTTRTSLTNMQSQTTRNINAIKTSWRGMQTALIASAEHIRSETGAKIKSLEHNMGSFWHKVQNPALLLAGGTESQSRHTTPRRSGNRFRSSSAPRKLMAGSPRVGQKVTGISSRFKQSKIMNSRNFGIRDAVSEYLRCLLTDGVCMAGGGWGFNWSPDIRNALLKWNTHFQKYSIDDYVTVGKFENDDFPVRGIAQIAKDYIQDAISRTNYEHYFNQKYGSPLEAWNAGHFNCVDGARVVIALANAFGFGGGSIRYTTWDGEGHGYAYIPGLGNIDATAIQGGYGLTASKVHYAGSTSVNRSSAKSEPQIGNQFGDVVFNVTINGNVDNAEETGKQIADEAGKRFIDMFRRSPATGL